MTKVKELQPALIHVKKCNSSPPAPSYKKRSSYMKIILFMSLTSFIESFPLTTLPLLLRGGKEKDGNCDKFFSKTTYNGATHEDPVLLGITFFTTPEQETVSCLQTLIRKDDYLLVEAPTDGKKVACETVNSAFKPLNEKLHCFGYDVPYDKERIVFNDLFFKIKFIQEQLPEFFKTVYFSSDLIAALKTSAENYSKHTPDSSGASVDSEYYVRNAAYLVDLANRMSGLKIIEIKAMVEHELELLSKEFQDKQDKLLLNATNKALVTQLKIHTKQLEGSKHRLFIVGGVDRVEPQRNAFLSEELSTSQQPVTILLPK